MQSETLGKLAKKNLVNMPYQWRSNFHCAFGNVIFVKFQFSYVSSMQGQEDLPQMRKVKR